MFSVVPWDLNMSFGGFDSGLSEDKILSFYIDEPTSAAVSNYPLVAQLMDEPEFVAAYHSYLQQLIDGPFSLEHMTARIDQIAAVIRPYVKKDDNLLFSYEAFEQGLSDDLTGSTGARGANMGGRFIGLTKFVQARTASIAAQLAGTQASKSTDGSGNGGVIGVGGMGGGLPGAAGNRPGGQQPDRAANSPSPAASRAALSLVAALPVAGLRPRPRRSHFAAVPDARSLTCPSPRSRTPHRASDPGGRSQGLPRSLLLAAGLYLWSLSRNGMANSYYAAAVKSASLSWKAFLFGSLDPGSFITVDKPPASIWLMALSARIFGFSSWSMLVPQALAGVGSVLVLHHLVRRWAGDVAALLAALVLALTPVAVLIFRYNNPDALLTLLLLLSTWGLWSAVETGKTWKLGLAGVALGIAFLTKMLMALLVAPAFVVVYLVCGRGRIVRRVAQLVVPWGRWQSSGAGGSLL